MSEFLVYDVFTDRPFGGNPLAVLPRAETIPENRLQGIAREFNFSETVFVFPPEDPAHTARLRIFTPVQEIPFAGHPTIGTAIALADLGHGPDQVLELGVGPVACRVSAGTAAFTIRRRAEVLAHPDADLVAACTGLPRSAIRTDRHPPVMASVGLPFVLAELDGPESLAQAQPVTDAFRRAALTHPSEMGFAILVYTRDDTARGGFLRARMFAPLDNIPEDPATGSAAAALTAWLCDLEKTDRDLDIRQGEDMGRPSRICCTGRRHADGSVAVEVSGRAVRVMQGRLTLD